MRSAKFQTRLMELQKNMLSYAYMLTANRDDAYDLLQATTVRALNSEDDFADDHDIKARIFDLMRVALADIPHRDVSTRAVSDAIDLAGDAGALTPEGSRDLNEIAGFIDGIADTDCRDAFALFVIGYPYCQIAERLGLSIRIVRRHIATARRQLR